MATATTQTKPAEDFEQATERVREYNDKAVDAGKKLSGTLVDTYEKYTLTLADASQKAGEATNVEWISAAASAQAGVTRELTKAYASAARELLK
jgi:hypothetical protein